MEFYKLHFSEEGRYLEWGILAANKAQEMLDVLEEIEEDIEAALKG